MFRHRLLGLVTALFIGSVTSEIAASELRVLFLGDRGHHQPEERSKQLIPVLAQLGIAIDYTEHLGDLNAEKLSRYDGLIVFANWPSIEPEAEKALLDFVANGGGFIPIHCASYCFLNSPAYIELVGAQFKSHGTGEFRTRITAPDHPIMAGIPEFRTWDETYVHTKHNEDRVVLQVRPDTQGNEPWTWVRRHGKGRVFYTAYGHDHRTWGQPGFHVLIERGIRWACGDDRVVPTLLSPPPDPSSFTFRKANLPNYLPGRSWGTQGDALTQMQEPLRPEASMRHAVLAPQLELHLFAADPEIYKPICMSWDARGRLWIAETTDYPNELKPDRQGEDRIKICEDSDGDGRADKFTIFADRLSIPTSLLHYKGGVIVHQAPHTLFLRDTDGDDRADERRVLFTGWSTGDTHAGPSNLQWGLDHWVYGMVGYSGFRGTVGGEEHSFRTGFYRFRPDGSKFEFLRNTNNNSWGVSFTEEGLLFGSTANGNPSVYLPIPNRYYESVRGWTSSVLGRTATNAKFYPISEKVRQVDHHGNFTAAAGHAIYTARRLPKTYWNRAAFVNGPTGHLVATFLLEPRGSDFVSRNTWNLLASHDEWTAPIMSEVGPDGAVWVIDWYNYIVQHNPTPRGFKTGKGNAYVTDLRDKVHGRIYRVVPRGDGPAYRPRRLDLSTPPEELVAALAIDNQFWRREAQRLLVERGRRDVVPALVRLVNDATTDAIGLNPGAIHALWTLNGLGALGDDDGAAAAARGALRHPSAGVRRNAILALPRTADSTAAILSAKSLLDDEAQVRLAAFLALAELPPHEAAGAAISRALAEPMNAEDRWIPDAATAAAARHVTSFLAALRGAGAGGESSAALVQVTERVAEHAARGEATRGGAGELLAGLKGTAQPLADAVVTGLARGWPANARPRLDPAVEAGVASLLASLSPEAQSRLVTLAERWGSRGLEKEAEAIAGRLAGEIQNTDRSDDERARAARQLIEFRIGDATAARSVIETIDPKSSPELVDGLLRAVETSESDAVGTAIVEALPALTPTAKRRAQVVLLRRAPWTSALLDAAEGGVVDLDLFTLDQKQQLARHPDAKLAAKATALLARSGDLPDPDRQRVIDSLLPITERTGDVERGKAAYLEVCAKCHKHGTEGTDIGPDLTGMAVHSKSELLVHILDPSRSVEGNFRLYTVVQSDGAVIEGMLTSESRTAIEIYDAEGKPHRILREDVESIEASRLSLMPAGFEKQLSPERMADLLEFLTDRGRFLPIPLDKAATVVSTRGMFFSERSRGERLVFRDWKPKVFEGVPFHLVDPKGSEVPNAILLHSPNGAIPPRMPKSVEIPCNTAARAIHLLSGVSGWGAKSPRKDGSVSMIVRLVYEGGATEDHPLRDGEHFADYIGPFDVPGSKLAFNLRGRQIRYLAVRPKTAGRIERIQIVKGPDRTAPIVMAVTVEVAESSK